MICDFEFDVKNAIAKYDITEFCDLSLDKRGNVICNGFNEEQIKYMSKNGEIFTDEDDNFIKVSLRKKQLQYFENICTEYINDNEDELFNEIRNNYQ